MFKDNQSIEGKVVVVTGASRGIGEATVKLLSAAGARVVGCGRSDAPDGFEGELWCTTHVADAGDVERLAAVTLDKFGRCDALVNNAGIQIEKTVVESTDEDWDVLIGTNAQGVFYTCRQFIPMMAEAGGGTIVNIGSISGNHADPQMALYNASKAFVHGLTRSIAVDHGAQKIRCNAICPGWIMTAMADAAFDLASDPTAAKADALARHPVGRFGQPEDIAEAVRWLISDASGFITGQTITVDGGLVSVTPLQPGLF